MKVEKIKIYNDKVDSGVDNEYPTSHYAFRQPCLWMLVGSRTSGKSYLTSKVLGQAHKEKTFDRIYIITPSFNSNKAYFGKYINEEDVFEPTKDSIQQVISMVENDRDEWEEYLEKKELYNQFKKDKNKPIHKILEDNLIIYYNYNFWEEPPKWKYEKEEPPKSLLILDDCLGSPAILQSSGLTRCATLNRHIANLQEDFKGRSACGLAVMILSQSYKFSQGISRLLRENLSLLTLFKNKHQKQMESIVEELANVVDENLFNQAYQYATKDKYGNLTIDFKAKCQTLTFRKNLNEIIKFDELKCECGEKKE